MGALCAMNFELWTYPSGRDVYRKVQGRDNPVPATIISLAGIHPPFVLSIFPSLRYRLALLYPPSLLYHLAHVTHEFFITDVSIRPPAGNLCELTVCFFIFSVTLFELTPFLLSAQYVSASALVTSFGPVKWLDCHCKANSQYHAAIENVPLSHTFVPLLLHFF
jgi:hypothetical protein